jgi:hypothetical protein
LSDYGVKPPNAPEKGVKKIIKDKRKSTDVGGSEKGGGIRLESSAICDALSLPRGMDEAKLLNRMKELARLSTDSVQSVVSWEGGEDFILFCGIEVDLGEGALMIFVLGEGGVNEWFFLAPNLNQSSIKLDGRILKNL